jgi:hypothetical protein
LKGKGRCDPRWSSAVVLLMMMTSASVGLCRWETRDGQDVDLEVLITTSLASPCSDRLLLCRRAWLTARHW